jgi:hypothetical protein
MWRDFVGIIIVLAALALLFPKMALAYIDPGVGSLILQGLAAAVISGLVFWSNLRRKVKEFLADRSAKAGKAASTDTAGTDACETVEEGRE